MFEITPVNYIEYIPLFPFNLHSFIYFSQFMIFLCYLDSISRDKLFSLWVYEGAESASIFSSLKMHDVAVT